MSDEQSASVGWRTALRVAGVVGVWAFLGFMLGLLAGQGRGPVALAISLVAGVIVTTPTGLVLSLFGGKWDEALIGGMIGALLGFAAASAAGQPDPRHAAAGCMIAGAFIGTTAIGVFYRLPRLLVGHLRPSGEGALADR